MFVLKKVTTVWWPVRVDVPDEKVPGRFISHEFEAEFRIIDADAAQARQDEREALLKAAEKMEAGAALKKINAFDFETWTTMVLNWRGVQDEAGAEIPFSDALLVEAIKQPLTRAAFERAYGEIVAGNPRRKN